MHRLHSPLYQFSILHKPRSKTVLYLSRSAMVGSSLHRGRASAIWQRPRGSRHQVLTPTQHVHTLITDTGSLQLWTPGLLFGSLPVENPALHAASCSGRTALYMVLDCGERLPGEPHLRSNLLSLLAMSHTRTSIVITAHPQAATSPQSTSACSSTILVAFSCLSGG